MSIIMYVSVKRGKRIEVSVKWFATWKARGFARAQHGGGHKKSLNKKATGSFLTPTKSHNTQENSRASFDTARVIFKAILEQSQR